MEVLGSSGAKSALSPAACRWAMVVLRACNPDVNVRDEGGPSNTRTHNYHGRSLKNSCLLQPRLVIISAMSALHWALLLNSFKWPIATPLLVYLSQHSLESVSL